MTDVPRKNSDQLAEDRTDMAWARSVMALERTLMAWVRTSLSMITFGFTSFKFLQALRGGGVPALNENAPRNLGLFLILLGMGLLALAIVQFNRAAGRLGQFSEMRQQVSLSLIGAAGVLLAGAFTLLNIFFGFGGF